MNLTFLKSRDFLGYWLPPLVWSGVVLAMSGDLGSSQHSLGLVKWLLSWIPLSPAQLELCHSYFRKIVGHAGSYGFLYLLWFRAFRRQTGYRLGRIFLCSLALCLTLALLDEGRQSLLTSRTGSLRDVAIDMAGVSIAAAITAIFRIPGVGYGPGK